MDVIGSLLRAGLLPQLGDDQERASWLRAASRDLADQMLESDQARRTIPVALIEGMRPSETSEILDRAEHALISHWETYRNVFPKRAIMLLQTLVLAAVAHTTRRKAVRQACWYTVRSARELIDKDFWAAPLEQLQAEWDEEIRSIIANTWAPDPASHKLNSLSLSEIPGPTLETTVPQALRDAAPQPHTVAQDLPDRLDELVESINEGLGEAVRLSLGQIEKAFNKVVVSLRDAISTHEQVINATRHRVNLLWWFESSYSQRLKTAYASLPTPADVALATAFDLHTDVPLLTPIAAEHLLADLVGRIAPDAKIALHDLRASEQAQPLRETYGAARGPILSGILEESGALVDEHDELEAPRVAVFAFRDMQAARLLG